MLCHRFVTIFKLTVLAAHVCTLQLVLTYAKPHNADLPVCYCFAFKRDLHSLLSWPPP
jgi:hypothetical protein